MAKYTVGLRNAQLDAISAYVGDNAKLRIYSGTQPASAGGALGVGNDLLAEFALGSPFANAAANGVLSPTLPGDTTALATGTASWFRVISADGTTIGIDGTVGTSGTDLVLSAVNLDVGETVSISSWSIGRGNA